MPETQGKTSFIPPRFSLDQRYVVTCPLWMLAGFAEKEVIWAYARLMPKKNTRKNRIGKTRIRAMCFSTILEMLRPATHRFFKLLNHGDLFRFEAVLRCGMECGPIRGNERSED